MKKNFTFLLVLCCLFSTKNVFAQQLFWSKTDAIIAKDTNQPTAKVSFAKIDPGQLKNIFSKAPLESTNKQVANYIPFSFLLPEGKVFSTLVAQSPIWSKVDDGQFNGIKTFSLLDAKTKIACGRMTLTEAGLSGILFTENGDVYIYPYLNKGTGIHALYYTKENSVPAVPCAVGNSGFPIPVLSRAAEVTVANTERKVFRLAVAATAEYTAWAGGQANALAYITISINNAMAVYDRDLNIRFTLIAPNSILFTNANTDPYPGGNVFLDNTATNANQTAMDNILGSAAYDVGIVFNNGWNRGYVPPPFAYVCNAASKAKCAAGINNGPGQNPTNGPQGQAFDFTVIHELGHQFGAPHSYASNVGICSSFATDSAAFEPGSGSTIMGYGGYADCNTYTNYGEAYFHAGSVAQIQAYISNKGNCSQTVITGNTAPVISLPAAAYTIPASTPFTLSASATDADGNTLLYNWEQMDAGLLTPSPPSATNTAGPNFRSYAPSTIGNSRTFPGIKDIAAGTATPYEVLSSVTRTMHFRLTARDQSAEGGASAFADVAVNVNSTAGPFKVTSQATAITWTNNSAQTIIWNVAGSNTAPVNCSLVDILFSTDGGITYPYTLVSNTNNDGNETITAPNLTTQTGRIKVQSVNNIFFNINAGNITITSSCLAEGTTITPTDDLAAAAGDASLNLSLSPQYGTAFTPVGTITNANPSSFLTIYNTSINTCATYGFNGSSKFNTHSFVVTVAGTYTFTPSTYGLIYNIYRDTYDAAFSCNNFIASNCVTGLTPTTIKLFVSAYLLPGKYVLVAGTFSPTFPVLPHTYSVAVTGGTIYSNPPNPGAAYSYFYVLIDKATNLIKSIGATANLSNATTFPGGNQYLVYGLSYANASPVLSSFVGTNFNTLSTALLTNTAYCGNLSKNERLVTVLKQYTFTGNGNWNVAANWSNNAIPPSPLPAWSIISINPPANGECVLNVPATISKGTQLIVEPGKKFRVVGNLTIEE